MRNAGALILLALALSAGQQDQQQLASFKTSVTLVNVPVVVRDSRGHAVGGLRKEDFRLFDEGQPREILKFAVESAGSLEPSRTARATPSAQGSQAPARAPDRFVAYLFDDLHLEFADLARVRDAAGRHFRASLQPDDRAAVYTTSGRTVLEFTADRDKLDQTLAALRPHPLGDRWDCPRIGLRQADLMVNRRDNDAIRAATAEQLSCTPGIRIETAATMAMQKARQVLELGEWDIRASFRTIVDAINRMATLPGKRAIVLASPGFQPVGLEMEESDLIDRAIRAGVSIGAIDTRGLWVDPALDASRRVQADSDALRIQRQLDSTGALTDSRVLADLAAGTGGRFFQNSNDLEDGFHQVAAAPEVVYLLAFSPSDLKLDGKYHSLKVTLPNGKGLTADSRKGYFAPRSLADPAAQSRQELFAAIYARDERNEIPVVARTQYYLLDERKVRLVVPFNLPLPGISFRKVDGRNANGLTVVTAVFDNNGNLLSARQQQFDLRLKDETLARKAEPGVTGRATFDLEPGSYLVRLVVRDAEGRLSAVNTPVDLSARPGGAPVALVSFAMQAPFFYSDADVAHVRVAAEFPPGVPSDGEVNVVGTVSRPDGRTAAAFSRTFRRSGSQPPLYLDRLDVKSGQYTLRLAFLANGKEAGSIAGPLLVEPHASGQFAVGGIAFNKDIREVSPDVTARDEGLPETGDTLAIGRVEYPLAGSRVFRPADKVGLYFVVYDPPPTDGTPFTIELRATDRRSGAETWDSGPVDASQYLKAGATSVTLTVRLPMDQLPPGEYSLRVTAAGAGGKTAVRSVDFDVREPQ